MGGGVERHWLNFSRESFIDGLIHGGIIVAATAGVAFFGALDSVNFFANLNSTVLIGGLVDAVNAVWSLFYVAVLPLVVNFARWDKK